MFFSLGLAGDMVGQEAGSGLWSGVSGVPGELSLFREFLPASFFIFCLGSLKHYISKFSLLWMFLPGSFYLMSGKF